MNKKINSIEDYLESLPVEAREIVQELRSLVQKTVPEAKERIAWSVPWYMLNKKWFVVIMNASHHVSFGFAMATDLHSDMLEGAGKFMRHIKIKHGEKVPVKEITKLLKQAAKLDYYH